MKRMLLGGAACLAAAAIAPQTPLPDVVERADAHVGTACLKADGEYEALTNSDGPIRSIVQVGPGRVRFTWEDGFSDVMPVTGPCAPVTPPKPEPEPTPTSAPPVPEAAPQEPSRPPTCAELRARYPGAGKVRLASWGCPATPVRVIPPVRTNFRSFTVVVKRVPCFSTGARRSYVVTRKVTRTYENGRLVGTRYGKLVRTYGAVCVVNG